MAATLPPDLMTRLKTLILPFANTVDDRDNLITEAFYLADQRLYQQIKREGNPNGFCISCIKTLIDFGCLTDGTHALTPLLNTIRAQFGVDKQHEIDQLVTLVNGLCDQTNAAQLLTALRVPPKTPTQTVNTPIGQRTPTVFISYSHQNTEFAQKLIADIQQAGHAVWIDTATLRGGDEWMRSIAEGIINSYAFILIATKQALESIYVRDEITWAKQRNKRIVTVLLEDVVNEVGFFPLVSYQGVKFYDVAYEAALPALLAGIPAPQIAVEAGASAALPVVSQRALELQYLDRLRFEILVNTEKYTPLAGSSHFKKAAALGNIAPVVMRPEYALLSRDREQVQEVRRFDNAVDEILSLRRVVVLGEPGAGKTTTLWKLARQLVDEAIADPQNPIPLVIRLGRWTEDNQPIESFTAQELGELGRYLPALLSEKRAVLLLDGLNEIPVSQRRRDRSDKDQQVKKMIERHLELLAVVSCRAQDYTLDLGFDWIEITPLDSFRILEFVQHYLGLEEGEKLFYRLVGENAAHVEQRFFDWEHGRIQNPMRVFWIERELPNGLKWGFSWDREDNTYWEHWLREREKPASLLVMAQNPYMLLMLTQVYVSNEGRLPDNRGELFGDFVLTLLVREKIVGVDSSTRRPVLDATANELLDGLSRLAYAMQIQRGQAEDGNALTVLPVGQVKSFLTERQLYLAGSASLLSVGREVRFSHQLLQEYFAARQMDTEIKTGKLKADSIWKPGQWWEATNWEEATILLAGLYSEDCSGVLDWIAEANPEVAARCIIGSGAQTPEVTRRRLQSRWLARLTDLKREPEAKARAALGRALGLTGLDSRRGIGLDENGLPDIDWVEIPAGEFIYQDGVKLSLPTFQITRYPVTYAQFQAFIDAADGFHNPEWWEGLAANEAYRSVPREQAFKYGNHPRERVSWYDAVAFCRWLSSKLGCDVRLPTEQEWEKSARGTDGQQYPYGADFDANKGNTSETGINQTSAVGIFPNGASPYGLEDMSGNVWEWCLNEYSNSDSIQLEGSELRVLRGGSWRDDQGDARAAYRLNYGPIYRYDSIGFRLLRSPSL